MNDRWRVCSVWAKRGKEKAIQDVLNWSSGCKWEGNMKLSLHCAAFFSCFLRMTLTEVIVLFRKHLVKHLEQQFPYSCRHGRHTELIFCPSLHLLEVSDSFPLSRQPPRCGQVCVRCLPAVRCESACVCVFYTGWGQNTLRLAHRWGEAGVWGFLGSGQGVVGWRGGGKQCLSGWLLEPERVQLQKAALSYLLVLRAGSSVPTGGQQGAKRLFCLLQLHLPPLYIFASSPCSPSLPPRLFLCFSSGEGSGGGCFWRDEDCCCPQVAPFVYVL